MSINLILTLLGFAMLMPKVMFDPLGPESGVALIETNSGWRTFTVTLPEP